MTPRAFLLSLGAISAATGFILGVAVSHSTFEVPATARAIDGDTFAIGSVHYRIASIDAPELPGHCRGFRQRHNTCAPGDPYSAKAALTFYLSQQLRCQSLGPDVYRRTLVRCRFPDGADLGQTLIAEGYAIPYHYQH